MNIITTINFIVQRGETSQ